MSDNNAWSIVQVYAPTELCDEDELSEFYRTLETAIETLNARNLIIMGDFNAQIGTAQQGEETVFGRYSQGKRSKHGQRLIEFAHEKNIKFVNTMFKTKESKKWTWVSPNGKYHNEIDFILTNKGSEIFAFDIIKNLNFNTDHRMIRCKIKLDNTRKRSYKSINTHCTRNLPTLTREDGMHWENEFIELIKISPQVQTQYDHFLRGMKHLLTQIPCEKNKQKYPISAHTRQLLEDRKQLYKEKRTKEIKRKITQISKDINKEISKSRKKHRQNVFEEYLSKKGAIKKAYKDLQSTTKWPTNMMGKKGRIVSRRSDIITEATDFYQNLYSSQERSSITQHVRNKAYVNESLPEILRSEINFSIETQKKDKAPGDDKITNEILKALSESLQHPLEILFNNILERRETPKQWSESSITLLHKKGDRCDLSNYRPISLMTNFYKIFSKILLNRLTITLDENQPREQAGFRKHYSTTDHIQVVTQIVEKAKEYGKTLYLCFIDYTKAFDSLEHGAIWNTLVEQGIDIKYVEILHSIYSKNSARIKLESEGPTFPIRKGVRQGDPLSSKIFSSVLESIFRNLDWECKGVKIDGEYLNHLRFADDIVVFTEESTQMENMLQELADESKKVGLTMNATKTKIITNGSEVPILIDGQEIEYVKEYIYLGQSISFEDQTEKEINRRIAISWKKYWSYKEIMKNNKISMNLKRKLYEIAILPCLTYGCQTWSLRTKDEHKLGVMQRKMERSMLGIKLSDRITNEEIRKKTKIADIVERIRSLKWKWAGHICRLENERWTKKIIEWVPRDGKRKRGRPRKRWEDIFKERCGPDWRRLARDREKWRKLGEAYAAEATSINK